MKRSILSVLLALVLVGCAPKAPPTTNSSTLIGTAAVRGRQLVIAGDATVTAMDNLLTAQVLTGEQGLPVLRVLRRVGAEAVRLADVLRSVDSVQQGGPTKLAQAKAIVAEMQRLLATASIPLTDTRIRAIVDAALKSFSSLLDDFALDLFRALSTGGTTVEAETSLRSLALSFN
jgi:RecA/RadA recombinase